MKIQELSLPEFTFIDHIGYKDNMMKGRQCIFHVRTATILELFADLEQEYALSLRVRKYDFSHRNERFTLALHYSFDEDNLQEIFRNAADWYKGYCDWEDGNILNDTKKAQN